MLKVYDSYEKKKRAFKPIKEGAVGMYMCGPTVYGPSHIGHACTYMRWDFIRQYLQHWKGYKVKYIQNLTDFGHLVSDADTGMDKMKKAMDREHKNAREIADEYIQDYLDNCLDGLKNQRPDVIVKATDFVPQMITYIEELLKRGNAYEANGNVYFDVTSIGGRYGKLMGKTTDQMKAGAGGRGIDESKKNHFDFVLWKKHSPEHAMKWESRWGEGQPGWHTECIVISNKYLGEVYDIKGGGMDNKFPHHECEIGQAIAMIGRPHANYFFHAGIITINNEKMAKSKGNFITVKDLLSKQQPEPVRLWAASTQYRHGIDYSEESIRQAEQNVEKLDNLAWLLADIAKHKQAGDTAAVEKLIKASETSFVKAMDDDFNTPRALEVVYGFASEVHKLIDAGKLGSEGAKLALEFLKKVDLIFKVINFKQEHKLTPELKKLVDEREKLRKEGKYKEADELRAKLREAGVEVQDTDSGVKIRVKKQ